MADNESAYRLVVEFTAREPLSSVDRFDLSEAVKLTLIQKCAEVDTVIKARVFEED